MSGPGSIGRVEKKSSVKDMEPKMNQNKTLQGGPLKLTVASLALGPQTGATGQRGRLHTCMYRLCNGAPRRGETCFSVSASSLYPALACMTSLHVRRTNTLSLEAI